MKVAIISDTHGNAANFKKVVSWLNALPAQAGQNIKLILHPGDIGSPESLKESLENFDGEFFGVLGNMDKHYEAAIEKYNQIPNVKVEEETFKTEIDGKRIAINHFPWNAKKLAQSGEFDLVFYGHTHRPWDEKIGECHMINPGELAGQFNKPTFAIYDTDAGKLELKILEKI